MVEEYLDAARIVSSCGLNISVSVGMDQEASANLHLLEQRPGRIALDTYTPLCHFSRLCGFPSSSKAVGV
jgi:hypothetical protein